MKTENNTATANTALPKVLGKLQEEVKKEKVEFPLSQCAGRYARYVKSAL